MHHALFFNLTTYHLLNESSTYYLAKKEKKKSWHFWSDDLVGSCLQPFYLRFLLNAFGSKTFVIKSSYQVFHMTFILPHAMASLTIVRS